MSRGRSSGAARRPLYQQTAETLARLLASTPEGQALPSEPELARRLGVSRATLREAMRAFEEQGLVLRRQGVGTFVVRSPRVIEAGLEVLESLETMAARIGQPVEMGALTVEQTQVTPEQSELFERPADTPLWQIARTLSAGGRPVAYLIDRVPADVLPESELARGFNGSVLDLFLRRGDPPLGLSRTEITAVSAPPEIARRLSIQRGDVLLCFEASLYSQDGRMIDRSTSYFLPGPFRFHVVRKVGGALRPGRRSSG